MQYTSSGKLNTESWLGDENVPLEGFSWQGGSEADTTGILMWSEVFCTILPNKEKVTDFGDRILYHNIIY